MKTYFLAAVMAAVLALDWANVSDTESRVTANCQTHIAYDKSGDIYCVDSSSESIRVAGVVK